VRSDDRRVSDLRLVGRLLREARPVWPLLAAIFGLSLCEVPIALLLPLPLKLVVDDLTGTHPFSLPLAAGLLVLVALLQHAQGFASWMLQSHTGERLVLRSRARLFQHAQRLSIAYHDRVGTADSLYRIHEDSVPAHYAAVSGLVPIATGACMIAGLLATTAWVDPTLAAIALVVVPVLVGLTEYYRRRVRAGWAELRTLDASSISVLQEVLGALRVVKAFGQERREEQRYLAHAQSAMRGQLRVIAGEATFGLLVAATLAVGTAVVLAVGASHVRAGALSLGSLLLVMGYLAQLYKPIETISKKVTGLQAALASAERTVALLDQAPDVRERADPVRIARAQGDIAFRGVSFAYQSGPPVLQDVSLVVPRGARVGIAGQTGAGKTTLASLLLRFFDPQSGTISLDGVDLRDYALADLRGQYALVLQDSVLFSTTIAENIAYGRPDATRDEIAEAARAAYAHDFIKRLPDGYDTRVGERGMTLSGGERQRVALARAFLKDAPILILDEPTSSIDLASEREILGAMERLMRGRTAFIIAHRLHTLAGCDLRIEMAHGRIVSAREPARAEAS
jgi:ATP-binding cassette subfamily B protein